MFQTWLTALEARHLANLTFAEVTRALRALSATYVERRERLARKAAFDSAGKRAAYALYYSPLHFLTVNQIAEALQLNAQPVRHILDLGCGAGAAGAAWAVQHSSHPSITGIDAHPWALGEATFTYRAFGLRAETSRADVTRMRMPRSVDAIVAGWMVNELDDTRRALVHAQLLRMATAGTQILIVEPIATRVVPWWSEWVRDFTPVGGRSDEWRFRIELPHLLTRLDRAAGLRHDELTARSIFVPQGQTPRMQVQNQ
jgi:SAM-dependent methyltransferase